MGLDEFDGWFAHGENGGHSETDMQQIENILLEVLDGMEDYNGIITMAMTNKPKMIPKGIMRRFRYVDIVGELTAEERAGLLKMYLEKTLPLHEDVPENYQRWAEKLADAPGDVVRKVVDELHFQKVPPYLRENPSKAERIEKILYRREMNKGDLNDKDIAYVRETLRRGGVIITPLDVEHQIDQLLLRPAVRMQINAAKEVYRDAKRLLEDLASGEGRGYGMKHKSSLFES
jgi:SpoVK/Ycf46/Vps4 family AAA+-type ATPase